MAGNSQKALCGRIRSMTATRQITRAMEMVASSRLRRCQVELQASRPYAQALAEAVAGLLSGSRGLSSPYLREAPGDQVLYLVIAGDRGLAGGYNSRVAQLAEEAMEHQNAQVLPLGKKALEHFRSRGIPLFSEQYERVSDLNAQDCLALAKVLCESYLAGQFREIRLAGTRFDSVLSQTPQLRRLLPLERSEPSLAMAGDILWEPSAEDVLNTIVPSFLGGILYGALCESRTAEQAARRTAMNSATENADELIGQLRTEFNRSRQAAITREITEIAAGS